MAQLFPPVPDYLVYLMSAPPLSWARLFSGSHVLHLYLYQDLAKVKQVSAVGVLFNSDFARVIAVELEILLILGFVKKSERGNRHGQEKRARGPYFLNFLSEYKSRNH